MTRRVQLDVDVMDDGEGPCIRCIFTGSRILKEVQPWNIIIEDFNTCRLTTTKDDVLLYNGLHQSRIM